VADKTIGYWRFTHQPNEEITDKHWLMIRNVILPLEQIRSKNMKTSGNDGSSIMSCIFFKDDTFSLNTGDLFERTKTVINKDGFIQRIQRTTDFVVWAYRDVIIRLYALRFI